MKYEKRKDREAKYKILYWLRIQQRCPFIATEVGSHSADCLGISEKKMVEVEVKISIADLKNDFDKSKHVVYCKESSFTWQQQWVPTHFYYAVPADMVEKCKEILEEEAAHIKGISNYGIINYENLAVEKRAKWIHKREPTAHSKFTVALRMGSELLRFHEAWV